MGSTPIPDSIVHKASDDLESLFYILLEFTMIYDGPGGLITHKGVPPENYRRWHKAYVAMDKDGLGTSGSLKKEFLMDIAPHYEPAPYFRACRPILEDWRIAMGDAITNQTDVSHDTISEIIQWGLNNIGNFPSPQIALPMSSTSLMGSSASSSAMVLEPQPRRSSRIKPSAHSNVPSILSTLFAPPPPPPSPPQAASTDLPRCSRRRKKHVSTY